MQYQQGLVVALKDIWTGCCSQAQFGEPQGITMDAVGNLYVADSFGTAGSEKSPQVEWVTTLAGSGYFGDLEDGTANKQNFGTHQR